MALNYPGLPFGQQETKNYQSPDEIQNNKDTNKHVKENVNTSRSTVLVKVINELEDWLRSCLKASTTDHYFFKYPPIMLSKVHYPVRFLLNTVLQTSFIKVCTSVPEKKTTFMEEPDDVVVTATWLPAPLEDWVMTRIDNKMKLLEDFFKCHKLASHLKTWNRLMQCFTWDWHER